MASVAEKKALYDELVAVPSDLVAEIIDGTLYTHPRPAPRHGATSFALAGKLQGPFQEGIDGPGGWIFLDEPELHLGSDVVVPDLAGWRRERLSSSPDTAWIDVAPDWVCEILSASTETRDRTAKMRIYATAGVHYLWLIDPRQQMLQAFELLDGRWIVLGGWSSADHVSVPPFNQISLPLASLWPFDRPLGFNENPQALYAGDR
jgi:Uma2 family endonuclease